jgi:hypothetical protein
MAIRAFTSQLDGEPAGRSIDDDAPRGLRHEFIDAACHVLGQVNGYDERRLHRIVAQSLGLQPAGEPYGGFRRAMSRDVDNADWPRVYDLICRLWPEVPWDLQDSYRAAINRILAAYHVAWDLGEDGLLHRVLPPSVQGQVETAFRELSAPRFSAALPSFRDAMAAYDDRPRRERDTCSNIFDALESVAKEIFGMPAATFGGVLIEARKQQSMAAETTAALQKLYDMANGHFRHGMITPFTLKPAEVDFILVSCMAGILLFVRL